MLNFLLFEIWVLISVMFGLICKGFITLFFSKLHIRIREKVAENGSARKTTKLDFTCNGLGVQAHWLMVLVENEVTFLLFVENWFVEHITLITFRDNISKGLNGRTKIFKDNT